MFKIRQLTSLINNSTYQWQCFRHKFDGQYLDRQQRIMQKLMHGKTSKKIKFYDNISSHLHKPSTLSSVKRQNTATRRVTVLNKMFMKYVTDLMAHSWIAEKIAGCSVEITAVKVCQNFNGLHVYWTAASTDSDSSVEEKLVSIAGPLRHEMSQLRLMGEVPKITFVKDRTYAMVREVNRRLLKADFGEDFDIDQKTGILVKKHFETEYEAEMLNKQEEDPSLPPMRHDVMGLDHKAIMNRIKGSLSKTRKAWQMYEGERIDNSEPEEQNRTGYMEDVTLETMQANAEKQNQDEKALQEFLNKRKFAKKQKREMDYGVSQYLADFNGDDSDEDEPDVEEDDSFIDENIDSFYSNYTQK